MNHIKTSLLLLTLVASLSAQAKKITITVSEPGTLSQMLSAEKRHGLSELTLHGTLDGDDWLFLRSLMGVVRPGESQGKGLCRLDISDICFEPGKECIKGTKITRRDELPAWAFEDCRVGEVILPASALTIGHDCFQRSTVRHVVLPEGCTLAMDAFIHCPELREVVFPKQMLHLTSAFNDCAKLQRLEINDVEYISARAIHDCPQLREIIVRGDLGHIDGSYTIYNCPELRRIVFKGYVLSTGGSNECFPKCPKLREIVFEKAVLNTYFASLHEDDSVGCYRNKGIVFNSAHKEYIKPSDFSDTRRRAQACDVLSDMERTMHRITHEGCRFHFNNRFTSLMYSNALAVHHPTLAIKGLKAEVESGSPKTYELMQKGEYDYLAEHSDYAQLREQARLNADYIGLLRASNNFCNDTTQAMPQFTYDLNSPILARVRQELKLDSIAGTGDEVSRIKRVMYWLHDLIRHDGSSRWPDGSKVPYNAADLIAHALKEHRGYNCRFLAMILTDCYQALGMPARYLTCESRWKNDQDCHVITIVWSKQLHKWVWMDPSFAAYITDENGLLLHHGEVRERLATGQPLVLNPDANWNHTNIQTKDNYLETYMAKNLYTISCSIDSRPELESSNNPRRSVVLVPDGVPYKNGINYTTSDPNWFWQEVR